MKIVFNITEVHTNGLQQRGKFKTREEAEQAIKKLELKWDESIKKYGYDQSLKPKFSVGVW